MIFTKKTKKPKKSEKKAPVKPPNPSKDEIGTEPEQPKVKRKDEKYKPGEFIFHEPGTEIQDSKTFVVVDPATDPTMPQKKIPDYNMIEIPKTALCLDGEKFFKDDHFLGTRDVERKRIFYSKLEKGYKIIGFQFTNNGFAFLFEL